MMFRFTYEEIKKQEETCEQKYNEWTQACEILRTMRLNHKVTGRYKISPNKIIKEESGQDND